MSAGASVASASSPGAAAEGGGWRTQTGLRRSGSAGTRLKTDTHACGHTCALRNLRVGKRGPHNPQRVAVVAVGVARDALLPGSRAIAARGASVRRSAAESSPDTHVTSWLCSL